MKFQYFSCALIQNYQSCRGITQDHNEVHFALFGRDVSNNQQVAVTFRYCPYLMFQTLQEARPFHFTHSDLVQLTPLHGFTREKISFHRVFVPVRKRWECGRKQTTLDYHNTLITQMLLVLGLKPLDVVTCESVVMRSRHTNVIREYHIQTRLSADHRWRLSHKMVSCAQDQPSCRLILKPTLLMGLSLLQTIHTQSRSAIRYKILMVR